MDGFSKQEITMNAEEDSLDADKKIGSREVVNGMTGYDSRGSIVVITTLEVRGG